MLSLAVFFVRSFVSSYSVSFRMSALGHTEYDQQPTAPSQTETKNSLLVFFTSKREREREKNVVVKHVIYGNTGTASFATKTQHTHTIGRADTEDNMMNHNNNNTANSSIHKKTNAR